MRHSRHLALALVVPLLGALGACEAPTEIFVRVDGPLLRSNAIDRVTVEVTGPGCVRERRSAALGGAEAIAPPLTLSLRHHGGPTEPVEVTVIGALGDDEVMRAFAAARFEPGSSRTLDVELPTACARCASGQWCVGGECVPMDLEPTCAEAPVADGGAPRPDAGAPADAGDPACPPLTPSNVSVPAERGSGDVVFDAGAPWIHVDTTTGAITGFDATGAPVERRAPSASGIVANGMGFHVVSQGGGGPRVAVLSMASLHVEAGVTVHATGEHPLVLLVDGEAVIDGTLSVAAGAPYSPDGAAEARPGAGGARGGAPEAEGYGPGGGGVGAPTMDGGAGGAGGSFGTVGAAGAWSQLEGAPGPNGVGGAARSVYGEASLTPLLAGSGGGAGVSQCCRPSRGRGGDAGGALQISARCGVRIGATGVVDAGGGGGEGGAGAGGGGGGGSGGAVLLEAPAVRLEGAVRANGGAGGNGAHCHGCPGTSGLSGATTAPAAAGALLTPAMCPAVCGWSDPDRADDCSGCAGRGGAGSDLDGVASPGGAHRYAGGGGGGAGRIRIRGDDVDLDGARLEPRLGLEGAPVSVAPLSEVP